MPLTVLADADELVGASLRSLLSSWAEQYPADAGAVLRLVCREAPEATLERVATALAEAGYDPDEIADIEIAEGTLREALRAGQVVLAPDESVARTVADRGSLPLRQPRVPLPPSNRTETLRQMLGFTGVQWIAETRRASGYASEARMFVRSLEQARLEPGLAWPEPTRDQLALSPADERLLRRAEQRRPAPSGSLAVWHRQPIPATRIGDWAATACRTMWETDTIPEDWPALLRGFTRVWVPTEWARERFAAAGVPESRLRVLAGTIDLDLYRADGPARDDLAPQGGFTFLSAFDFQERKGWRPLLEAYFRDFKSEDGVTLVLKLETIFAGLDEIRARIAAFLDGLGVAPERRPAIVLLHERLTDEQMAELYRGAGAYVSPTRGEGWGRPMMEALACGCPVIASRWSGQLAFLDDANATLVDGEIVPVPDDIDIPVLRGGRWFDPDLDALRAGMRAVASDPAGSRARAHAARGRLEARFGPLVIAERVAELALDALSAPEAR